MNRFKLHWDGYRGIYTLFDGEETLAPEPPDAMVGGTPFERSVCEALNRLAAELERSKSTEILHYREPNGVSVRCGAYLGVPSTTDFGRVTCSLCRGE